MLVVSYSSVKLGERRPDNHWSTAITSQLEKCNTLAELHRSKTAWIIPNPWDVGSAIVLEGLGFKAIATTSSGFAYTLGRADGEVSLEEKLLHCKMIAEAISIPLNADFENGFADDPDDIARNIDRLAQTGIAGYSIEDYSRDDHTLYDFDFAVERIEAAVNPLITAGKEMLETGTFSWLDSVARGQEIRKLIGAA